MTPSRFRDLERALAATKAAEPGLPTLQAAHDLRRLAERLERAEVARARAEGLSWSKIGSVYGLSKQGAQQRFRDQLEDPAAADHTT